MKNKKLIIRDYALDFSKEEVPTRIQSFLAEKNFERREEITQDQLLNLKKNFDDGVFVQRIPVTLDHSSLRGRGSRAVGWINGVEVEGNALYTLVEWTEEGAKLLKDKAYSNVSIEIHEEFTSRKDGKTFVGWTMTGLSLTNYPAVFNLNNIQGFDFNLERPTNNQFEGETMTDEEKKKMAALEASNKKLTDELKGLKDKKTEADATAKLEKVTKEFDEYREKAEAAERKSEIDKLTKEGIFTPSEFDSLSSLSAKEFENVKAFATNRGPKVNMKSTTNDADAPEETSHTGGAKESAEDKLMKIAYDSMKEDKNLPFEDAFMAAREANPELDKKYRGER